MEVGSVELLSSDSEPPASASDTPDAALDAVETEPDAEADPASDALSEALSAWPGL